MSILRVQHIPENGVDRFHVVRLTDGKTTAPAAITAAADFSVKGRPDSNLVRELRWYLEEFLGYPFPPETDHAKRVLDALHKWGRAAFDALFDNRQGTDFLRQAQQGKGYEPFTIQIASDDPRVLAWPWEALEDSQAGLLAQTCRIERRVNQVADPRPVDERLPRDRVNILLVTARPYTRDVRLRSISRPLVELINEKNLAAEVTVLRPPTFDQLRRHLAEHPHTYHVLHFDGHGGYGDHDDANCDPHEGSHRFQGRGVLVFEQQDGSPDEIAADQLANLLQEHAVPAVVLNACQSAMIDEHAADPFASVAAALLKSGSRSVVAMAYSLYVSGARLFVPAFYENLFDSGDTACAVRAGRQQMYADRGRICARGKYPLDDWLVPVVYQQDPLDFSFVAKGAGQRATKPEAADAKLPPEARDTENPYGFVGRDGPLLELERAMLRPPAGVLIQGLGGVGKTTLARGFVEWLNTTGGLGAGCLWLDFREIRSAEFVINRMGEALFGGQFSARTMDEKLGALAAALREQRVVIVWDNFEVARGIEGTYISANLTADDRAVLLRFLKSLRGAPTKVLITSRSREEWLGYENCFELSVGGFDDEERWEYCAIVLRDLGMNPDRDDPAMTELMDALGGHPLAMRAILPQLKDHAPEALAKALRNNADALDLPESDVSRKLAATLRFVQDALPAEQQLLLGPLSMHENFVDLDYLERMAKQVDERWNRAVIDRFAAALTAAGLLRARGQGIHELHPALTGYLRTTVTRQKDQDEVRDAWARAFVDVMSRLADALAPRAHHDQRIPFHVHGVNFHFALSEAERLGLHTHQIALVQSLAVYAKNTRDFAAAERLFTRLTELRRAAGDLEGQAGAFHQLGRIAEEQRDFTAAGQWYRKSLAIKEKLGYEHGAAITYHQLGNLAEEQRDFTAAEQWYRKSLAVNEKQSNEHGAALTFGQLGNLALEQRDFAAAGQWYRKALDIFERLGIEQHAASTHHQLGRITEEQRDFAAAEQWYRKSLAISEKQGNKHAAAITYHQLGVIAKERGDFTAAEQWYRKSLAISEKQGHEHGAARTYGQLGILAGLQDRYEESGQWLIKCVVAFRRCNHSRGAHGNASNFMISYGGAPPDVQARLAAMWRDAGLGDLPPTPGKKP